MKEETKIKKVIEDETIDPLMKKIWLECYHSDGLTNETLDDCRNVLKRLPDDEIIQQLEQLSPACYLTELGAKEPTSLVYQSHLIKQFLTLPEVHEALLKVIRN